MRTVALAAVGGLIPSRSCTPCADTTEVVARPVERPIDIGIFAAASASTPDGRTVSSAADSRAGRNARSRAKPRETRELLPAARPGYPSSV